MKLKLFIIVSFTIVTFFSSDIFLPSIPEIAHYFSISKAMSKLSVVSYFGGQILSTLFWGALADRLGYQKTYITGIYVFLLGTVMCLVSSTFSFFVFGRIIAGIGSVVSSVVGLAIIQKLYPRDESAGVMSVLGSIIALAPMIAPSIGGFFAGLWGWKSCFYFILIMTVFVLTFIHKLTLYDEDKNESDNKKNIIKVYKQIISHKMFLSWVGICIFLACGQWGFMTVIPFFYKGQMDLSPQVIGELMSLSSMFFIIGAASVHKIIKYISIDMLIKLGISISLLGSMLIFSLHTLNLYYPLAISVCFGIYLLGVSLLWGSASSRALQCFDEFVGSASAIRSLLLISAYAVGSFLGTLINDTNLFLISILMVGCTLCSATVNRQRSLGETQHNSG